ncbi:MAG: tetratricopeptide repeat protein, partial [Acidobacteria bacterium]|nr:tetratricopeptide repeat protein [Acidobacteriota bacterium]
MSEDLNKSPKEILNDIKQLYYQHQFPEALQLCKRLVARFPNNQDLKGLLLKIESRAQKENFQKSGDWQSSGSNNLEATQYYTERAEHEMNQHEKSPSSLSELYDEPDASASDQAFQVEQLIQKGVQLYEVQDYAQALQAWRQALTLDPTNQLAQDYVRNVSNLMNESSPAPRSQTSAPPPSAQPPDKQQLLAYYNEGLQLYK